jgi:hypothetical protein
LPSGTLWADRNVGADSPEGYAAYFAWCETTPRSTYSWSTNKWYNGTFDTQTKYCTNSNNGTVDNKIVLDAADDAATANWGSQWRMPTRVEHSELRDWCTWTWTTLGGVKGYKVTGPNGNSIFLPAAGCRGSSSLYDVGSYGFYWSSTLLEDLPYGAWGLDFGSSNYHLNYYGFRYFGHTVRAVVK